MQYVSRANTLRVAVPQMIEPPPRALEESGLSQANFLCHFFCGETDVDEILWDQITSAPCRKVRLEFVS